MANINVYDDTVLIYAKGKGGGKSIQGSLNQYGIKNIHIHRLRWESIQRSVDNLAQGRSKFTHQVNNRIQTRCRIDETRGDVRWKIITTVRDPVATEVSIQFTSLAVGSESDVLNLPKEKAVKEIMPMLFQRLESFEEKTDSNCNWFDLELKDIFDFDVYSANFDNKKDYQIFRAANADVLLLKLDKFNVCHKAAFKDFFGIDDFQLINNNNTVKKYFGSIYKHFRETGVIPINIWEKFYSTRYARYFYTERETADFIRKWSGDSPKIPEGLGCSEDNKASEGLALRIREYNVTGRRFLKAGDLLGALKQFSLALKACPDDKETVLNCVQVLSASGDTEVAKRLCRSYLQSKPNEVEIKKVFDTISGIGSVTNEDIQKQFVKTCQF